MQKSDLQSHIIETVRAVKTTNPMAGSITNSVTINFVANAQIAVGGSAAMVYLPDEGEFLAKAGSALYINVGTLMTNSQETMLHTAKVLHELGKQWVLDPVAIGIGQMRSNILMGFKDYKPSIIRGNASEIIALANQWDVAGDGATSQVRGVDSTQSVDEAREAAVALARFTQGAVAVSGEIDLVTDGHFIASSQGGSRFLTQITGSGCSLGGVCAVYACTAPNPFTAALTGINVYNLAGKRAETYAKGPGSFQSSFLDELYKASPEDIANNPFKLEEA